MPISTVNIHMYLVGLLLRTASRKRISVPAERVKPRNCLDICMNRMTPSPVGRVASLEKQPLSDTRATKFLQRFYTG